jgi:hypothetical protein
MSCASRGLTLMLCAVALFAQTPPAAHTPAGLESDWDVAPIMRQIGDNAARMLPLLDQIDVKSWIEKGASDTYLAQVASSREQARAAVAGAKELERNPEKLSASLELFFRVQALESMLSSLSEGIRRYQGPKDATALQKAITDSSSYRARLQEYLVNLAAEREKDLQVMDREAQRCRAVVTLPPARTGRKK